MVSWSVQDCPFYFTDKNCQTWSQMLRKTFPLNFTWHVYIHWMKWAAHTWRHRLKRDQIYPKHLYKSPFSSMRCSCKCLWMVIQLILSTHTKFHNRTLCPLHFWSQSSSLVQRIVINSSTLKEAVVKKVDNKQEQMSNISRKMECLRKKQKDMADGLPWWFRGKESTANAGNMGLTPGQGRSYIQQNN